MNATFVPDKLEKLEAQVAWLVEREQKKQELVDEMTPVVREVLATAVAKLDALEKRGAFALVRALGEAVSHLDQAQPIGVMGMMRASRDDDARRGMGVVMQLLREIGKAAAPAAPKAVDKRERLAQMLGPRRKTELKRLPAPARPIVAPVVSPEDTAAWTQEVAALRATEAGITLTADHWKVIDAARADFEHNKAAANIRRLTQITGLSTRELYALFPKAPGRTIARIAGTPKPAGCL